MRLRVQNVIIICPVILETSLPWNLLKNLFQIPEPWTRLHFVWNPFLVTVYDLSECCVSIIFATTEIERPVSGSWDFMISEIVSELFVVENTLSAFKYVYQSRYIHPYKSTPPQPAAYTHPILWDAFAMFIQTIWKPWHNVQGVPDTVSTYGKL